MNWFYFEIFFVVGKGSDGDYRTLKEVFFFHRNIFFYRKMSGGNKSVWDQWSGCGWGFLV